MKFILFYTNLLVIPYNLYLYRITMHYLVYITMHYLFYIFIFDFFCLFMENEEDYLNLYCYLEVL